MFTANGVERGLRSGSTVKRSEIDLVESHLLLWTEASPLQLMMHTVLISAKLDSAVEPQPVSRSAIRVQYRQIQTLGRLRSPHC
jgi:hypothetical protein